MNDNMKEYLCHMTDAEKKAYNAEYYRNHKNYWQDYYSKGQTVGRPTARQKYVTEGGNGVNRRGEGLGTGPIGNSGKNGKRTTLYENRTVCKRPQRRYCGNVHLRVIKRRQDGYHNWKRSSKASIPESEENVSIGL